MPAKRQGRPSAPRGRKPPRRSVARPVQAAAARAVEKVLRSEEAFALMIRKLEAAGWNIQRTAPGDVESTPAPSRPL
ncbi:MAG: hypothetical protein ACHQNA_14445 [Acidimicrobiales bacterium]